MLLIELSAPLLLCGIIVMVSGQTPATFECTEEGRFPDSEDCGLFYDCIENPSGGFSKRIGSCSGNAYDVVNKTCVPAFRIAGCKPREGKAIGFRQHSLFDHLCDDSNITFTCGNCESVVQCIDGSAVEEQCGDQSFCQKHSIFGGVCRNNDLDTSKECSCEKVNSIKSDLYDKSHFFYCNDQLERAEYSCPIGMTFNLEEKVCKNARKVPACERMGTFVVPENCSIYYTCIQTPIGWLQTIDDCPSVDLFYNKTSGECEDACSFGQGEFKCDSEGRFSDPSNCSKYFECLSGVEGKFTQIRRSCPYGYMWSNQNKICVTEGRSSCLIRKPSICIAPTTCSNVARSSVSKFTR